MTASAAPITVLSSAIGLGVYIPALLIQQQLRQKDIRCEVEVLENYYQPKSQGAHIAHRDACQQDFALAQLAHRMSRDISDALDQPSIDQLLQQWLKEQRLHFIIWSGFWLPIIEQYRQLMPQQPLQIDHCRIDAEVSASFKIFYEQQIGLDANPLWLWHGDRQAIVHEIRINDAPVIGFQQRANRLVMHGGGWGIGTYKSKVAELSATDYALDIVVANHKDIADKRAQDRFFMMDPQWQPWQKDTTGNHRFPPMLVFNDARERTPVAFHPTKTEEHAFYQVIRQAKAIISKPGGCTLIDSLNAATPVILLEPYGYAEKRNAETWQALGFGISLVKWRASGYDESLLTQLHQNLLAQRKKAPDYVEQYIAKHALCHKLNQPAETGRL